MRITKKKLLATGICLTIAASSLAVAQQSHAQAAHPVAQQQAAQSSTDPLQLVNGLVSEAGKLLFGK
jgi:hypothetical protein